MDLDLKVDAFNIKEVQLKLPAIKHKWIGRLIRHKLELSNLQKQREARKKDLVVKVCKESPIKITDFAAEKTVESSSSLKDLDDKIYDLKLVLELLEKSEKTFSSMTWDLKNCIDIMKAETM